MSGAAFILLITVCIASLFCATFTAIALYDRSYNSARWFAASFAMGVGYAVAEFLLPYFSDIRLGVFLGHMAFLATLVLLNIGLARRYVVAVPVTLLLGTFAVSLVASVMLQDLPRGSFLRMFLYQAPFALMQAIGLVIVLKARSRRPLDRVLEWFLAISALQYLAKPFLATGFGGSGPTPQDYLNTTYAMISQSMGAVLVVAMGLLLLTALALDVVKQITARSETDLISGLLNRRGFEERMAEVSRNCRSNSLPVSLIFCDLDHFKAVNDTYGHAIGDRVIRVFAETLRANAASDHVLGRIGGEEFAIILPGSNLGAARLYAEAVRTAFAEATLADLPAPMRFTASFGVAEIDCGETQSAFMARADMALYEAKRSGRDCVRVGRVQPIPDTGHTTGIAS